MGSVAYCDTDSAVGDLHYYDCVALSLGSLADLALAQLKHLGLHSSGKARELSAASTQVF